MALRQELTLEFMDVTQSEADIASSATQARKVDLILCPTSTTLPPTTKQFFASASAAKGGDSDGNDMSAYIDDVMTVFANLVGAPALSIPAATIPTSATDASGQTQSYSLPVGMQLVGAPGTDMQLLDIGAVLQQHIKL